MASSSERRKLKILTFGKKEQKSFQERTEVTRYGKQISFKIIIVHQLKTKNVVWCDSYVKFDVQNVHR